MKYLLTVITITFLVLFFSGCGGGSSFGPSIPDELDGDWNLKGKITANDGSYETEIDQNFEIRGNRLYLDGSDEIWIGSYYTPNLHIRFDKIVQDEDVVGCGTVVTTAIITVVTFITDIDETQYDSSPVGLFETNSDCDGITRVEINGALILKRI